MSDFKWKNNILELCGENKISQVGGASSISLDGDYAIQSDLTSKYVSKRELESKKYLTSDEVNLLLDTRQVVTKPEITNLANKTEIPDVTKLATKSEIATLATKTEIPDVTNLATKSEIPDIRNLATKTEIATLATKQEVEELNRKLDAIIAQLQGVESKKEEHQAQIEAIKNFVIQLSPGRN